MVSRKLLSSVITLLFLLIALPVSAHDLPMGASRWSFGNSTITGCIDLKSSLMSEIRPIKEGHYDLDAASAEQLRQIAAEVIQPYIDKRLSLTVDEKTYPVKVNKITRNGNNLYTIWLSVDDVAFHQPENRVRIGYSLLLEETNNEHVSLAYGYVSDATGDALQKVFDYSPPAFQTTFDSNARVWEFSVKGSAHAPAATPETESPVVSVRPAGVKHPAAQKSTARNAPPSVSIPENTPNKRHLDNRSVVASTPSVPESPPGGREEHRPLSQETVKRSLWPTVRQFVPLGIEHILTGYDHIAFLLAIIVIGLSIREVLQIITAFTIAHSITLLLAALEIVSLNSRFVESAIAFSICYVALENMFKRKVHYRWLITFGFGLIHGFGFASALKELIVGKSSLLLSVVSFNMGVEIGQLTLFFVMLPLLYLLKKQFEFRIVTVSTSVGIFVIGFTWLVERLFHLKLWWF